MQNETIIYGYARVSTAAQDESAQVKQLELDGCGKIFHEKITGTGADRPQLAKLIKRLAPGDVVITPAVDRLSRDTTDLLVIARDMQRAGAGIRSRAELSSIRPRTLPRSSLRSWALLTCSNAAAFWSAPRATGPTPRPRALSSAASRSPAPAARGSWAPRSWRDAAQHRPQLQCQPEHDLPTHRVTVRSMPRSFA
jgi:hypothetical protein